MKKTQNFLVALIIVIGAAITTANAAGGLEIKSGKVKLFNYGKLVKLIYLSNEAIEVEISIEDANGQLLYTGTTSSKKGFLLPINMSQLPLGTYVFSIKDGDNVFRKSVTTTATATDGDMLTMVQDAEGKGFVVTSTEELPSDVYLVIYDENGELIHTHNYDSQEKIGSKYDLESIESDEVRVVIKEGDEILKDSAFKF